MTIARIGVLRCGPRARAALRCGERRRSRTRGCVRPRARGDAARVYVDITSDATLDARRREARRSRSASSIVHVATIGDPTTEKVVKSIAVPAGTTTRLAYLGDHLRFIDIKRDVGNGDPVPLTLLFKDATGKRIEATTDVLVRGLLLPQQMPDAARDAPPPPAGKAASPRSSPSLAGSGTRSPSTMHDLVGDGRRLGQHDRRRAVLFLGELHRPLDLPAVEAAAGHRVDVVQRGEDAGRIRRPLGLDRDHDVGRPAWRPFLRIETTSKAVQAAAPVSRVSIGRMPMLRPPLLGRAVDHDGVSAAGFADEAHPLDPFDPCFHVVRYLLLVLSLDSDRSHLNFCNTRPARDAAMRQNSLHGALQYATIITVRGLAVLLLRHRGPIPPFSSYGGILDRRGPHRPRLFLPRSRCRRGTGFAGPP